MDGHDGLASRMRDIAPFHVMEVQTAARALEARGRSVIHRVPVMPSGGFFVYADCSPFGFDSERFALEALEATGVAFTPGIDFGRNRPEAHVRFACTIAQPLLEEGVQRLARWLPAVAG